MFFQRLGYLFRPTTDENMDLFIRVSEEVLNNFFIWLHALVIVKVFSLLHQCECLVDLLRLEHELERVAGANTLQEEQKIRVIFGVGVKDQDHPLTFEEAVFKHWEIGRGKVILLNGVKVFDFAQTYLGSHQEQVFLAQTLFSDKNIMSSLVL